MKFNSYEFIFVFLPIVLAVFFMLGHRGQRQAAVAWLAVASLGFYAYWNPVYLGLILISILFNFTIGGRIAQHAKQRRGWLLMLVGVAANLALLGYYKYTNFFADSINAIANTSWQVEKLLLPLAISFFTFQQIAYLVDSWKGAARDYNFLHYCLFVSFFPQLIAGPIVHHKEMMPQFDDPWRFSPHAKNFAVGMTIFIIGLAKKTLIADELALYADPVFSASDVGLSVSMVEAWGGVLAYTFQIYFDFSGYSDMAIGLACLFGIHLPLNFFSPYRAHNIIEFWRHWNMTLSRFLRDYIYIPLGGNRLGHPRRIMNVMITMLLGGLWHGAGWNFVIWGGLHGTYLLVNQSWNALFPSTKISGWITRFFAWGLTFLCIVVAWVFFRAETFSGAWSLLIAMSGQGTIYLPEVIMRALAPINEWLNMFDVQVSHMALYGGKQQFLVLGGAAFIAFLLPNTQQIIRAFYLPKGNIPKQKRPYFSAYLRWRPVRLQAIIIGALGAFSFFALARTSTFLYFNF